LPTKPTRSIIQNLDRARPQNDGIFGTMPAVILSNSYLTYKEKFNG
jgi:hypothetical protein